MKQHITIEQLNELSPKAKEKLRQWLGDPRKLATRENPNEEEKMILDNYLDLPLLSIGLMIEFLDEHDYNWHDDAFTDDGGVGDDNWEEFWVRRKDRELCDALFEAVKQVLEEKE